MTEAEQTELFRHQCEVRYLIRQWMKYGDSWIRGFLLDKHVVKRASLLRKDIWEQYRLGNRGEDRTWLTNEQDK